MKTRPERFAAVEARVRALHSYEVPEVISPPLLPGRPAIWPGCSKKWAEGRARRACSGLPSGVVSTRMAGFNAPFRRLRKQARKRQAQATPKPRSPILRVQKAADDAELFQQEMKDVTPLNKDDCARVSRPSPAIVRRSLIDEENEALAELYDLVAGRSEFDVTDTDEYIEGCVVGLDTRLVHKLRQGAFSRQASLDLHGMTADEAEAEVKRFVLGALCAGLRCILVIHGRGRNSPGQTPVLKDRLKYWLTSGLLAKVVLAFATARAYDGGPGALYILLRHEHAPRQALIVLEGAKR